MHILMASSEMAPLAKTGGLGDVLGALPRALARKGHRVTVVLPFYRHIDAHRYGISTSGDWFDAWVGGRHLFGGLHSWHPMPGLEVILVAQDDLYGRHGIYGGDQGTFWDNHLRFIFLSHATLQVARRLAAAGNAPDIFHGHDWHVGLIPLYLKEGRAGFHLPSVFSIHNLQYQGRYAPSMLDDASLSPDYFTRGRLELYGTVSFMKAGLVYSDLLSTVSRAYAKEIQTLEFGEGLSGLLRSRSHDLFGIINGVDTDIWDPATDPYLPARYSSRDMSGKAVNKRALQREFGLPPRSRVPLIVMVSRLVQQKGIDLVGSILPTLLRHDVQFIVQGTGDRRFEEMLRSFARSHPYQVGIRIGFDEAAAHRVEAGGDMFMMPSLFEPCGLNQLYSLRYGTVPVVRAVGGLDDTVRDVAEGVPPGNGFKFESYDAHGLWWALERALEAYEDTDRWERLRVSAMDDDISWELAADSYVQLYEAARVRASQR